MLEPFFYGLITGISLCLMLGTVFFALIQNSVDNGFKSGIYISLGVVISDAILITISMAGTTRLPNIPHFSFYVSILGAILLFVIGLNSILKSNPKIVYPKTKLGSAGYYLSTGFLLNILNPMNLIIWGVIATKIEAEKEYDIYQKNIFFLGCILAIFATEIGISFSAFKLKKYFTTKVLLGINRFSGIMFIIFAIRLIYGSIYIYK